MAILKCKMCGGDLELVQDASIATCEFCGSVQTVPKVDDEKKLTLFARANRLRVACEFDKAAGVYESIVADFPEEAEAYWGLVLCKYGIEYVDDPATGKKIPTCHRSSFDSIMEDSDFDQALENADGSARKVYREEAKQIEELRKGIIAVSSNEQPYDIFICYKETDETGDRTLDSVLAQDIYDALTDKGYRVFFSRITLEDKLGQEYEPYIFAALNSAKIMLAVGTDYEYYNAVWVKNEWSRYLKLMAKDKEKYLIPCYKGIDAYDMPKEFAKLQAQDLGKVGAIQDLLRGIGKYIAPPNSAPAAPVVTSVYQRETEKLLNNARIHLQEKSWGNLQTTCEQIIAQDPSEPWAYVYQLMRVRRVTQPEQLADSPVALSNSKYYQSAIKYADSELKEKLERWNKGSEEACRQAEERCAEGIRRAKKVRGLIAGGELHAAFLTPTCRVKAFGQDDKGQCKTQNWFQMVTVACGQYHTAGIRYDGTARARGSNQYGQCNVADWTDMINIACGHSHTVGLKKDGTVVACGLNDVGQCGVQDWKDIVEVACGQYHTLGLKKDGTVVSTHSHHFGQCDVGSWSDIVAIRANHVHSVGLRKNGTVVFCGHLSDHTTEADLCKIEQWTDIVEIADGTSHILALKRDGTVLTVGDDAGSCCSGTAKWKNIVGISCGSRYSMGVTENGQVSICGEFDARHSTAMYQCLETTPLFTDADTMMKERLQLLKTRRMMTSYCWVLAKRVNPDICAIVTNDGRVECIDTENSAFKDWKDVVQISGDVNETVGLRRNGTIYYAGNNKYGTREAENWNKILYVCLKDSCVVGLREDGTAEACGNVRSYRLYDWSNIRAVFCDGRVAAGIDMDGKVYSSYDRFDDETEYREIESWSNITHIAIGAHHIFGLRGNGTVYQTGTSECTKMDAEGWRNIFSFSASHTHVAGLRLDGTVVASGRNTNGECNVQDWQDMAKIACGDGFTVGIRADGVVLVCGADGTSIQQLHGIRDAVAMCVTATSACIMSRNGELIFANKHRKELRRKKVFDSVDDLEDRMLVDISKDPNEEAKIWDEIVARKAQRRQAGVCQHCGGEFKGLLTKRCVACWRKKDSVI